MQSFDVFFIVSMNKVVSGLFYWNCRNCTKWSNSHGLSKNYYIKTWMQLCVGVQSNHLPLDKVAAILQVTFSNAFLCMKSFVSQLKFHWSLFLRGKLTISQLRFRLWLGTEQATSHYLNQCWPSSLTHIFGTRGRWGNKYNRFLVSLWFMQEFGMVFVDQTLNLMERHLSFWYSASLWICMLLPVGFKLPSHIITWTIYIDLRQYCIQHNSDMGNIDRPCHIMGCLNIKM